MFAGNDEIVSLTNESPEHQAFSQFVRLTLRKREIAAEARELDSRLRALEPQVLAYLGEGGYQRLKIEGYTLSPHRDPWVSRAPGFSDQDVIQALRASDLGQYVKEVYSVKSLTSYLRDLEEAAGTIENSAALLPEPLAKVLQIKPTYSVHVTKTWR